MSSLASPVHGSATLSSSLIAFYATAATVIPVLFVALAVQGAAGQQIGRLLNIMSVWGGRSAQRTAVAAIAVVVLTGSFGLIVGAGGLDEFLAIYALYQGQDIIDTRQSVLMSVLSLIIIAVAGPLLTFFGTIYRHSLEEYRKEGKAISAATSSAEADKTSPAEPDKTDAE